jgi:peptidoglycan-associated lipoprotein
MTRNRLLISLALPIWAACSHAKPEVKAEPPPAEAVAVAPAPEAAAPQVAAIEAQACTSDDQCQTNELCIASTCRPIVSGMPECTAATVHFDFDRSDLEDRDLPLLQRAARCLHAIPSTRAVIAGNADERGTSQYNVALGFRRANAIEKYLQSLDVPPARLHAVSYGKEAPICRESTEACWAKNRRADISRSEKP